MARRVQYHFVQNLPRISNPHIAGPEKVWGLRVPRLRDDTPLPFPLGVQICRVESGVASCLF